MVSSHDDRGCLELRLQHEATDIIIRLTAVPSNVPDLRGREKRPIVSSENDDQVFDILFSGKAFQVYQLALENNKLGNAFFHLHLTLEDARSFELPIETLFDNKLLQDYIALRPDILVSRGVSKGMMTPPTTISLPLNILSLNFSKKSHSNILKLEKSSVNFTEFVYPFELDALQDVISHLRVDCLHLFHQPSFNIENDKIENILKFLIRDIGKNLRLLFISGLSSEMPKDKRLFYHHMAEMALTKRVPAVVLSLGMELELQKQVFEIIIKNLVDGHGIDRAVRNARSQIAFGESKDIWGKLILYMTPLNGQIININNSDISNQLANILQSCGLRFEYIENMESDIIYGNTYGLPRINTRLTDYDKVATWVIIDRPVQFTDILQFKKLIKNTQQNGVIVSSNSSDYKEMLGLLIYKDKLQNRIYNVIRETKDNDHVRVIPIHLGELERITTQQVVDFGRLIQPYLGLGNPFQEVNPITDPAQFYGQDQAIETLTNSIINGQHVGIFGLRRVGKTSLLRQCEHIIKRNHLVVFIDLQLYGSDDFFNSVATDICNNLWLSLNQSIQDSSIYNSSNSFTVTSENIFKNTILDIMDTLNNLNTSAKIVIMLDEVDRMLPSLDSSDVILEKGWEGFERFLRVIRGLAQQTERLVLVTTSTKSDISRTRQWSNGRDNPFAGSMSEYYVRFLNKDSLEEMLVSIASWMDVTIPAKVIDAIYDATHGHAYLARQICSKIVYKYQEQGIPTTFSVDAVDSAKKEYVRDANNYLDRTWAEITERYLLSEPIMKQILETHDHRMNENNIVNNIQQINPNEPRRSILNTIQELRKLNILKAIDANQEEYTVSPRLFIDYISYQYL